MLYSYWILFFSKNFLDYEKIDVRIQNLNATSWPSSTLKTKGSCQQRCSGGHQNNHRNNLKTFSRNSERYTRWSAIFVSFPKTLLTPFLWDISDTSKRTRRKNEDMARCVMTMVKTREKQQNFSSYTTRIQGYDVDFSKVIVYWFL